MKGVRFYKGGCSPGEGIGDGGVEEGQGLSKPHLLALSLLNDYYKYRLDGNRLVLPKYFSAGSRIAQIHHMKLRKRGSCPAGDGLYCLRPHGRRLCSNWFRHGSTTISYPQCSLTFLCERYLHRCREQSFAIRAYAMSAVGIDVVSVSICIQGREHC